MNKNNVLIVYFSGTGGTKLVAETFEEVLSKRHYNSTTYPLDLSVQKSLGKQSNEILEKVKILFVIYPVYAFDAPSPIYDWIKTLPLVNDIPTVVLSVSGGGEVWPNTSCRAYSIKELKKKGFNVFYDKMLVMPSNVLVKTNDHLSMWVLKSMPVKVEKIVDDIITGKSRRTRHKLGAKMIHYVSRMEKKYANLYGLSLNTKDSCNSCGWCARNCPMNNIAMVDEKPTFSNKCIICMRCIYGCPSKAIYNGKYKYFAIEDGYSIRNIEERMKDKKLQPIKKCSKGFLWLGVRRYLLDTEEK